MRQPLAILVTLLATSACEFQKQADQKFGDQHFKTAIALIELHRTRTGEYPEELDDIEFIGEWDSLHLHSVAYEKLDEGYRLDLTGGWATTPDLEYPSAFWKGLGIRRSNVTRPPAEIEPRVVVRPPDLPDREQCEKDNDCVLTAYICSPCGRCPVPLPAVNKRWLEYEKAACEWSAERPAEGVACAACPPLKGDQSKWPTKAVCVKRTCRAR